MYSGSGHGKIKRPHKLIMLKYALLALIARRPRHGYDLKSAFETAMGGTWPINIGQIYTTLSRLERDQLVDCTIIEQDTLPDRKVYRITEKGEKALDRWLTAPIELSPPLRDDLYVKVLAHQLTRPTEPPPFLDDTRRSVHAALAAVERHAQTIGHDHGDPTALLLDAVSLQLQTTLRWLDRVSDRLSES